MIWKNDFELKCMWWKLNRQVNYMIGQIWCEKKTNLNKMHESKLKLTCEKKLISKKQGGAEAVQGVNSSK